MRIIISLVLLALFGSLGLPLAAQVRATVTIRDTGKVTINKDIYGQFAEHLGRSIYDGFYRNGHIRMDVVAALKSIRVPNLRWPGGCFADQYHWRDGIGPNRPKTVNTTWGMVTEDNSFGTEEFLELCRLIGCQPYIAGNVGTGSPQEMKDWITYLNYNHHNNVSLLGVGNESWGCGGNMTPEYYASLYKQFAAFLPDYPGTRLKKIISGANGSDYRWTQVIMKNIKPWEAYGLSLHYYTLPTGKWNTKGSATQFNEQEYAHTLMEALKMDTIITHHERIMDQYDPQKRMALLVDEWGVWTDVEPGTPGYAMYQQNSLRDALIAATTLNIFNNHADRVRGANLAQTVNVIHSLILTKGDRMLKTPTYWVFDLYKVHQDAHLLPVKLESPLYRGLPAVNASASADQNGVTHLTLVNLDAHQPVEVTATLPAGNYRQAPGQLLHNERFNAINTFEKPDAVSPVVFNAFKLNHNQLAVTLPPLSVVMLTLNPEH